jgi:hypothetical protein
MFGDEAAIGVLVDALAGAGDEVAGG